MSNKSITNITASVKERLSNISRRTRDDFNALLTRYCAERFLYRLGLSRYSNRFILKGASLFILWSGNIHRATKDVDLLGLDKCTLDEITLIFREIISVQVPYDDGMFYNPDSIVTSLIREDRLHDGIRVCLMGMLGTARIPLQVDIGFGDGASPEPRRETFPALLDYPGPDIIAYSMYTAIAEKFEAMVELDMTNSRMKDFFDICLLTHMFPFEMDIMRQAIVATFKAREKSIPLTAPVAFTKKFYKDAQKQTQWTAFIKKARPKERLGSLADVVVEISNFLLPVLQSYADEKDMKSTWTPGTGWS